MHPGKLRPATSALSAVLLALLPDAMKPSMLVRNATYHRERHILKGVIANSSFHNQGLQKHCMLQ